jgi:hypothetical protein
MAGDVFGAPLTIANGATRSEVARIGPGILVAVKTPAALTGTIVSFRAAINSADAKASTPVTYPVLQDDGTTAVGFTYAASSIIGLDGANADALAAVEFVQLISNQTELAARAFVLLCKRIA